MLRNSGNLHLTHQFIRHGSGNLVGPQSFVTTNDSIRDELYDLLALILGQGSDGMDTDLADEELAKQMSVEVQIIMHLATKWLWNQVRTDTCYVRVTLKRE